VAELVEVPALTVHQPWAWAVVHGHKPVENRRTRTKHRGLLAIHAGVINPAFWSDLTFVRERLTEAAVPLHWDNAAVPTQGVGVVVGLVDVVGVCDGVHACSCGPWAVPGPKHWQFANARPLAEPVPARGNQGLWTVELPAELLTRGGVSGG
jgi:hypothetical protein